MHRTAATIRLAALAALTALAALPTGTAAAASLGITVEGGFSTYAMDQLDEYVDAINRDAGATFIDHLDGGANLSVGLVLGLTERFELALAYERLGARTEYDGSFDALILDMPADAVMLRPRLVLRRADWPVWPLLQVGVGYLWADGRVELQRQLAGPDEQLTLTGGTLAGELLVGLEQPLTRFLTVSLLAGARLATVRKIDRSGYAPSLPWQVSVAELDYTGFMARLGVSVRLGGSAAAPPPQTD